MNLNDQLKQTIELLKGQSGFEDDAFVLFQENFGPETEDDSLQGNTDITCNKEGLFLLVSKLLEIIQQHDNCKSSESAIYKLDTSIFHNSEVTPHEIIIQSKSRKELNNSEPVCT